MRKDEPGVRLLDVKVGRASDAILARLVKDRREAHFSRHAVAQASAQVGEQGLERAARVVHVVHEQQAIVGRERGDGVPRRPHLDLGQGQARRLVARGDVVNGGALDILEDLL